MDNIFPKIAYSQLFIAAHILINGFGCYFNNSDVMLSVVKFNNLFFVEPLNFLKIRGIFKNDPLNFSDFRVGCPRMNPMIINTNFARAYGAKTLPIKIINNDINANKVVKKWCSHLWCWKKCCPPPPLHMRGG